MTTIPLTQASKDIDAPHKDLKSSCSRTNMIQQRLVQQKAIGLVIPELAGKFDGMAIRYNFKTFL